MCQSRRSRRGRANALPLVIVPRPCRAGIKGWVVVQAKSSDVESYFNQVQVISFP
jgi:hypothetical protein